MGVGADWVASAIGKVVSRKSPREFVSDRSVSATNGAKDEMSREPSRMAVGKLPLKIPKMILIILALSMPKTYLKP